MEIDLTEKQAYMAMFRFLEILYETTGEDYLGGLLGDLSLLEDGSSADQAMLISWKKAVHDVVNNKVDVQFRLLPRD